jgi:hypothetical protein
LVPGYVPFLSRNSFTCGLLSIRMLQRG